MRRFVRVVLLVVGAVLTVAGAVAAVLVGPSDMVSSGDRELTSDTAAVTTSPELLDFTGATLHVAATAQDGGEVFVGVGHEVDVRDYLERVAHDEVREVGTPWPPDVRAPWPPDLHRVAGAEPTPEVAPGTRDWWYEAASGSGRQEVSYQLADEPVSVVVMSGDGEAPVQVDVEVGLEVEDLFTTTLLVLGAGLVLLATGIFALRHRRRRAAYAAEPDATHELDAEQYAEPARQRDEGRRP